MRRGVGIGLLALALYATLGTGAPVVTEEKPTTLTLPAWQHNVRFITFRAGERALVIASGTGASPLTLYIYDPDGNCIARDDVVDPRGPSDDVAAEWFPLEEARYTIELRNVGSRSNRVDMITR